MPRAGGTINAAFPRRLRGIARARARSRGIVVSAGPTYQAYGEQIQRSFGCHDVSQDRAQVVGAGAEASEHLGAQATGGIWTKATGDAANLRNKTLRDGTFNEDLTEMVGP